MKTNLSNETELNPLSYEADLAKNFSPPGGPIKHTLLRTGAYAREHPLPVVLGSFALGAALGYVMVSALRPKPTFRERLAEAPMHTLREAIFTALTPAAHRLHKGYDSARDMAAKATDKVQDYFTSRPSTSWGEKFRHLSSNIKFW